MNFSHGDYSDHKAAYDRVRAASNATGRAVGLLADLQGPKIRLGRFADGPTYWADGETVCITVADCLGNHDRVSTTYKQLSQDAFPGDRVLVDDGNICAGQKGEPGSLTQEQILTAADWAISRGKEIRAKIKEATHRA